MPEGRPRPWITYALIAANVAMFGVELAHGASPVAPTPQQILDLGGSFPPLTLGGQWWRLGSSMFLHFGALHIGLNMLCLYQARVVEQLFGHVAFVAIYLLAGLGGGVATLMVGTSYGISAGASGAVFGVYGAFGAFLVLRRAQIDAVAWQRTARSLGSFLVLNLIIGLSIASISLSAHGGGLIVGFAVGAALLAGARAVEQRTLRVLGLAALGLALTAVAVMTLHAAPDSTYVLERFEELDGALVKRWNDALRAARDHKMTDPELAQILEREVIPPYRKMRQDTLSTDEIPSPMRSLFQRLDEYTAARLAAWEIVDQALRQPDPAQRNALQETYKTRDAEVRDRLAALDAEIRALSK